MEINELAILAKNGDQAAFEQIYNQMAQKIFYYIKLKIQNRQDAEDTLQEVFVKAYKGLSSLRPGELNFSGWLYTIAGNTINDYLRKKYRRPETVAIDEYFEIADSKCVDKEIMEKLELETAMEGFKQLPGLQRSVLELRFLNQLSVSEVAKALNKTSMSVRMLQYRARKELKSIAEKAHHPLVQNIYA